MYSLDVDSVVKYAKNIADCHRCRICDKLDGTRWRYWCGHTCCDDCVITSSSCFLCLTPLGEPSCVPVQDIVLSKRVQHANHLLSACQDTFAVDVFMRQRVLEQQKLEKEVFPECIQAPVKYSNKRKSSNITIRSKDSISFLPGEKTSPVKTSTMDKSLNYVQHWLDQTEDDVPKKCPRKPLSLLNMPQKNFKNSTPIKSTSVKSTSNKSNLIKSRSDIIVDKFKESEKNILKRKWPFKNERDESGIVMDDPIYIDDSQDNPKKVGSYQSSVLVQDKTNTDKPDKDILAWLAVIEAEKNTTPSQRLECDEVVQFTNDDIEKTPSKTVMQENMRKVPFLKKSYLKEPCQNCTNIVIGKNSKLAAGQSKDVEITIESSTFITKIKMTNIESKMTSRKQSSFVQTDISDINHPTVMEVPQTQIIERKELKSNEKDSLDLFTSEPKISDTKMNPVVDQPVQKPEIVGLGQKTVISDSDSDDGINKSESLLVTADVHRSSDQFDYGVFSELERSVTMAQKRKLKKRGHTPNSSDSSDKENRDPNRAKRIKNSKKLAMKKKNTKKLAVVNC